jgi:predicted RNA-binding protein (virulence factor B family)
MSFAEPGQVMSLPIARIERNMAYLDCMGLAIPLSLRELKANDKVGDHLEVFIWTQRDGELIATRRIPTVLPGKIAFLQVTDVAGGNGFVDIGLDEDAVLFTNQQEEPIQAGHRYYMTLLFDPVEQRLVLSTRIRHLFKNRAPYKFGDEVDFMIMDRAERGKKILVDMKYNGFVSNDDLLPGVRRGDRYKGYVQQNDHGGLIITMFKQGREKVDEAAERILDLLNQGRGYLRLNDNTPAEEIKMRLKVSKKTFKQAVGQLYKQGKVELTPRGIKRKGQA